MKSLLYTIEEFGADSKERLKKEFFFMAVALLVAKRSTCKRLHVGAVIVDKEMRNIIATGYNGNYAGGPNTCDSEEPGNCGCIHAEINALLKPVRVGEEIMFITDSPCKQCAKAIINSGIKKVYYLNEYRLKDGVNLLKKADIKVIKL